MHQLNFTFMTKKLLFATIIILLIGLQPVKAQNANNSDTKWYSFITEKHNVPKHAVSLQVPFNPRKLGIGARYSYNFTDILRFTVDADWYFYTGPKGCMKTITPDLSTKGTTQWGRQLDINANINLVFGDGNFNFYLIAGFYGSLGHSKIDKLLKDLYSAITSDTSDDDFSDDDGDDPFGDDGNRDGGNIYHDEDGNSYIYTDKVKKYYTSGFGINAGFGVELQTSDRSRFFIEQQLSLGLMTVWMPKIGWSYCF